MSWVTVAIPKIMNTTAPATAWLCSMENTAEKRGRQCAEDPQQTEAGEGGHAGRHELVPSRIGEIEAAEANGQSLTRGHRLGHRHHGNGCDRQKSQVHLEDEDRRVRTVLGEQAGNQRAEPEATGVCRRGHQGGLPRISASQHLGEGGGPGAGHETGGEAGQDPGGEQPADGRSHDEHDGAASAEGEGGSEHISASDLIGGASGEEQGGEHAGRIDGKDQGHHAGGEVPLALVDDIERGGQGGPQHGDGEHVGDQPEGHLTGGGEQRAIGGDRLVEAVETGLTRWPRSNSLSCW